MDLQDWCPIVSDIGIWSLIKFLSLTETSILSRQDRLLSEKSPKAIYKKPNRVNTSK